MADKRVLPAGLAAGALGGILVERRQVAGRRRMPHLKISQRRLTRSWLPGWSIRANTS
jgi:hypothetical protein